MRSYGTGWDNGNFSVLFADRYGPRRRSRVAFQAHDSASRATASMSYLVALPMTTIPTSRVG